MNPRWDFKPLDDARRFNHPDCVKYLEEYIQRLSLASTPQSPRSLASPTPQESPPQTVPQSVPHSTIDKTSDSVSNGNANAASSQVNSNDQSQNTLSKDHSANANDTANGNNNASENTLQTNSAEPKGTSNVTVTVNEPEPESQAGGDASITSGANSMKTQDSQLPTSTVDSLPNSSAAKKT